MVLYFFLREQRRGLTLLCLICRSRYLPPQMEQIFVIDEPLHVSLPYLALLATLHALRDCLARDEAVYIGAQLPTLLRGLYYEGWHPTARPATKSRNAFLERIHDGVHRDPGVDAEQVARAVFALLATRLPAAEIEDAKAATPSVLHNLWPS